MPRGQGRTCVGVLFVPIRLQRTLEITASHTSRHLSRPGEPRGLAVATPPPPCLKRTLAGGGYASGPSLASAPSACFTAAALAAIAATSAAGALGDAFTAAFTRPWALPASSASCRGAGASAALPAAAGPAGACAPLSCGSGTGASPSPPGFKLVLRLSLLTRWPCHLWLRHPRAQGLGDGERRACRWGFVDASGVCAAGTPRLPTAVAGLNAKPPQRRGPAPRARLAAPRFRRR
eukprot:350389-Chlamydomonas_euryale.AAC.3